MGTRTQCPLRKLWLFWTQQPTRLQDLLALGNRHARRRPMHRATSDANLFFAIQEVDVQSSEPFVWRVGQHRNVSGGLGVLRSGAVDPGRKSKTSSSSRNHHSRFGGHASIGGTFALPVAAGEKQRRGSRARASGRSQRQIVEVAQRKDHGDGGPETRIKIVDIARATSQRMSINHERKWIDALQTRQPGRCWHLFVSRQHLQRRDGLVQIGSQERGLEIVKERWTLGTAQCLCRRSRREERSRTRRQERSETKSQFCHKHCQCRGETCGKRPLRVGCDPSTREGCVTFRRGAFPCGWGYPGFRGWSWRPFSRRDDVNPDAKDRDDDEDDVKRLWRRLVHLIPSFGLQETTSSS